MKCFLSPQFPEGKKVSNSEPCPFKHVYDFIDSKLSTAVKRRGTVLCPGAYVAAVYASCWAISTWFLNPSKARRIFSVVLSL